MKKRMAFTIISLSLIFILLLTPVSAGWFSDVWGRITGKVTEETIFDMLIFISPQYSNDAQIEQAINGYVEAVNGDLGWKTKVINIISEENHFKKIDEIIEEYYNESEGKLKACIMVGEDIHTALHADYGSMESPSTTPWATLGGESAYYFVEDEPESEQVVGITHPINITISLIYPTHDLGYQTKASQIIYAFDKFSKNRGKIYPKNITVFISEEIARGSDWTFIGGSYDWKIREAYQTLDRYGDLIYKEEATEEEIFESLTGSYMMYNVAGHSLAYSTGVGETSNFQAKYVNILKTPFFTAHGCHVGSWFSNSSDNVGNGILDPSVNKKDFPTYGSRIFVNPYLRAMVLGFPGQDGGFIIHAMPEMASGKTLAESIIGHTYQSDDVTIWGDPTFYYNISYESGEVYDFGGKN